MPGPPGHLRGLVRDGPGPRLAAWLLASLHDDESCFGRSRRSTLGPMGVRFRSRPHGDELGRQGHLSPPRAAGILPAVRPAPRRRRAGARWLLWADPPGTRQRDRGPAVGIAGPPFSVLGPQPRAG